MDEALQDGDGPKWKGEVIEGGSKEMMGRRKVTHSGL